MIEKFSLERGRCMQDTKNQDINIQEIIAAGQRLAAQGLVHAHSGNISHRLDAQNILITASGVFKGSLNEQDVLLVDYQGLLRQAAPGKRPSSEMQLHSALYLGYPQIKAIIHAHPPYVTALSSANRELDWQMLEEAGLFLGRTPLVPRLPAGSMELARAAAKAAAGAAALLLAGHGAVSWGESIDQALCRMEILEHTAQVMLLRGFLL
jgi:L-fuculose-phosphate aldolase